MSREVICYKNLSEVVSFWGKEMEKGSTRLIFTLVSGFEAYSTTLGERVLVDSSV